MTEQQLAAMKQALEALEFYYDLHGEESDAKAITAIRTAIEQAETAQGQEPFVWLEDDKGNKYEMPEANKGLLLKRAEEAFESAKQREWVGLTNEELIDLTAIYSGAPLYCAIEQRLKEKNT